MATGVSPYSYAEEWLQFEQLTGGRFNLTGDIASIRAQFLGLFDNMKAMLPPPSNAVSKIDLQLPEGDLKVRIYYPTLKSEAVLPIGLYIHSGGWVAGGVDYEDHICRYLSEHTPTVLVCPEYRLAPEHPFPAGLNDCVQTFQWMTQNASTYSASPELTYLIGGSAGGNLALATALKLSSIPGSSTPKAVFASCTSSCEPSAIPEKYQEAWHPELFLDSAFLDRTCMETCIEAYGALPADPLFSVLLHPNLGKLPRTYLVACTKDPTHDEILMLKAEMAAQGADVELKVYEGYPHFFFTVPILKATVEYLGILVQKIQELFQVS